MGKGRTHFGTGIRRELDIASVARSLRTPGIDPRVWLSYGTVGTFDGDSGQPDFTDPNAIYISPDGVDVDVILSPSGEPVTCRYTGIQGGKGVVGFAPIHPGDEVVVGIPGGEHGSVPVILAVLNAAHTNIPLEQDGTPVFKNDRLSLYATAVPIELRTNKGAFLRLNADDTGTVQIGAADATEQAVLGTTYRRREATLNGTDVGLQAQYEGLAAACVGPLAPLKPFFLVMQQLYANFEAEADGFLSSLVKNK